jgi:hypothetical protein
MYRPHHTWLHLPEFLIFLVMTSLPVLTSSSSFPPLSSSFVIPRHLYIEHVFVFLCYQHITVPFILQVVFEHLFLCIFYIIKRFSRKLDFPMTQKKERPVSQPFSFYCIMFEFSYLFSTFTVTNSYSSYPSGLFFCHLHASSHISRIPRFAFQPSSFSALDGSA